MDNDATNKSNGEEEFSFVEDQAAPSYEPSSPKPNTVTTGESSPRKKIFILIGIVIAVFCLYKLYGLFSTTSTKAPEPTTMPIAANPTTTTPTVKASLSQPASTSAAPAIPVPAVVPDTTTAPEVTATPTTTAQSISEVPATPVTTEVSSTPVAPEVSGASAAPTETVPEAVAAADKDIKNLVVEETEKTDKSSDSQDTAEKLNKLEQAISQNGAASENLQQQIGGLTNAISGIQDNIAQLTQQINSLSEQMKKPQLKSTPVVVVHKTKAVKHAAKSKTSVYVPSGLNAGSPTNTMYFVKAMIQGRAWLISPDGATFTISSGDNLPGYGQILSINPDRGVVMTSSGRVIDYMPQDR